MVYREGNLLYTLEQDEKGRDQNRITIRVEGSKNVPQGEIDRITSYLQYILNDQFIL